MSCSVCAGHSSYNCPCCGESTRMMSCPDCEDGFEYWSFNIKARKFVRVTQLAFSLLPFDEDDAKDENKNYCQGYIEKCSTCKGEGEIPKDY